MILKQKLPEVYHRILSDLLQIEIPDEKIATCDSCILCQSTKSPYLDVKCCNYFPNMPNYLLGGILSDQDESLAFGQDKIRELIVSKVGTIPLGILPGKQFSKQQDEILKKEIPFHSKEDLEAQKCPYLDEGKCSVWKYRENLCVTFFCSSSGGKNGSLFWSKLNELLKIVEFDLAKHFSENELNYSVSQKEFSTKLLTFENDESDVNDEKFNSIWTDFDKEKVYKNAFKQISNLNQVDFEKLIRSEFFNLKKEVFLLSQQFKDNEYPVFLVLNPEIIFETSKKSGKVKLVLNKKKSEVDLAILPFLKLFNGKNSTNEVFQKAFKILFSLNAVVDELIKKKMLIHFTNQ